MSKTVSPAAFDAWAGKIKLKASLRAPLKLVYCDRRTATWAARECGLVPGTVLRAAKMYPFGVCPCCGEPVAT